MNLTQMGDLTRIFTARRDNFSLKSDLNRLTRELSTGTVADLSAHLRSDTNRLAWVDRKLSTLTTFNAAARQSAAFLGAQQHSITGILSEQSSLKSALLASTIEPNQRDIELASDQGREAFDATVSLLNRSFAGKSLFAGTATDQVPLPTGPALFAALETAVDFSQDSTSIIGEVEAFFSDAMSGYSSEYNGTPGQSNRRPVGPEREIDIGTTAQDDAFRKALTSMALAAVAAAPGVTGRPQVQSEILTYAVTKVAEADSEVAYLQGRIGAEQNRADIAISENSAQHSALAIERNEMVSADPYETATALHEVEQQLETHYLLTGRLSKLSLMDYI